MLYSAKQLVGQNEETLGKWFQVTPEEYEAIRDSLTGENYARGATGKSSLRLYYDAGYAVVCTHGVTAETHPAYLKTQ